MGLYMANIEPSKMLGSVPVSILFIGLEPPLVADTSPKGEKLILKTNSLANYFILKVYNALLPLQQ